MTWRAMTKVSVGCGLCRTGRMHAPIGGPLVLDASEATGAFGGKRAARSRSTLRRNGASGRIAGDGEHGPPTVGFAVAITSFGFWPGAARCLACLCARCPSHCGHSISVAMHSPRVGIARSRTRRAVAEMPSPVVTDTYRARNGKHRRWYPNTCAVVLFDASTLQTTATKRGSR